MVLQVWIKSAFETRRSFPVTMIRRLYLLWAVSGPASTPPREVVDGSHARTGLAILCMCHVGAV